jgi:penicillin amidase
MHLPKLGHPLSALFPDQAAALDRVSAPVGGDNDTVFATGCTAATGMRAVYASLSRYVIDVGAWQNCRWIVFHGASGEPDSPWHMNQNATWAAGEMVPMLYDWTRIAAEASFHRRLSFADGRTTVVET